MKEQVWFFVKDDNRHQVDVGDWLRWDSNIGYSYGEVVSIADDVAHVVCDGDCQMEIDLEGNRGARLKCFKPIALEPSRVAKPVGP